MFLLLRHIFMKRGLLILTIFLWTSIEKGRCLADASHEFTYPDIFKSLARSSSFSFEVTIPSEHMTYRVDEEHRGTPDVAVIRVLGNGSETYWHYVKFRDVLLEETGDSCTERRVEEIPSQFSGWITNNTALNNENFGPSTILRRLYQTNKPSLLGERVIRGVKHNEWMIRDDSETEIHYLFSDVGTESSTLEGKLNLPIQFEVIFLNSNKHVLYRMLNAESDRRLLAKGTACTNSLHAENSPPLPVTPDRFSYSQEVIYEVSPSDGNAFRRRTIYELKVTHNEILGLTRIDMSITKDLESADRVTEKFKIIRDRSTGLEYVTDEDSRQCSVSRLNNGFLASHPVKTLIPEGRQTGGLSPFYLDSSFSYEGVRRTRGFESSLWTTTLASVPEGGTEGHNKNYSMMVVNHYFVKPGNPGTLDLHIPISSEVLTYSSSDSRKVQSRMTSSYFDLHLHQISSFGETYAIEECISEDAQNDGFYIILAFPLVDDETRNAVKNNKNIFKEQVLLQLLQWGHLTPFRVTSLEVSMVPPESLVDSRDIVVTKAKILPSVRGTQSFRPVNHGVSFQPSPEDKIINGVTTAENCAQLCSQNDMVHCKFFHYCERDTCVLTVSDVAHASSSTLEELMNCTTWNFIQNPQNRKEVTDKELYDSLLRSIRDGELVVKIPDQGKVVSTTASDALQYPVSDLPMALHSSFSLKHRRTWIANPDVVRYHVPSLEHCLEECLNRGSWCRSVAYSKSSCAFSSSSVRDLEADALKPDPDASIYERSYYMQYDAVFGGVALEEPDLIYPETDMDDCARLCSENVAGCLSFDWCHDKRECHFHTKKITTENGPKHNNSYLTGTHCMHFSSNHLGNPSIRKVTTLTNDVNPKTPYTAADMVGVAAGMILLGFLLAAGYLVILVMTAPASDVSTAKSTSEATMTYLSLKSVHGESDT